MSGFRFPRYRVLQFAKLPRLGQVKTRMASRLSPRECLQLHCRLTTEVFANVQNAKVCPQALWVTEEPDDPFFVELVLGSGVPVFRQAGEDLGARMLTAVTQTFSGVDVDGVILIGSDCPFIDSTYLADAVQALEAGADGVMGPALDGGYVLLGLRQGHPALFTDIDWGTAQVAAQTRRAFADIGLCCTELSALSDIDRPEDLARLPGRWNVLPG